MPQASDELRAQWPGGDRQATAHLEAKGFTLTKNWTWILPFKTYLPTERDFSAIQYLIDEWDYHLHGLELASNAPDDLYYQQPRMTPFEQYFVGWLSEEAAESIQMAVGKTLRFGFDTPGRMGADGEPDFTFTPRSELHKEVGDALAAIDWAFRTGVLQRSVVYAARDAKYQKILNGRDNLGRYLAPPVPDYPIYGPEGDIWEDDPNPKPVPRKSWKERLYAWFAKSRKPESLDDF